MHASRNLLANHLDEVGAKRDRVHIHEQEIATEVPFPSVVYPVGVGRALVSPVAYEHLEGPIKRSHFQVQEPIYRRLGERGIILPKMYRRPAEIGAASYHAAALRADVLLGTAPFIVRSQQMRSVTALLGLSASGATAVPYKLLNSSEDDAAFNERSVLSGGTVAARDLRARLHFFDVRT